MAETSASISELKGNPIRTVATGEGFPVAILNHNEPAFYCVPALAFETMLDRLEDMELNALADARAGEAAIPVDIHELSTGVSCAGFEGMAPTGQPDAADMDKGQSL